MPSPENPCRLADECDAKRIETQRLLAACAPQLSAIVKQTAAVKQQFEKGLSSALGGRTVLVIGEINNVIT
jgi:hypothetical protein